MPNYENLNNGQFKKKIKPIIIASTLKIIIPIVAILVIATSAVLLGYIQKDSFFNSSSDILGEVAVENTNNGETDGQASSMLRISNENGYGEYILDTEKFTAKMYLWFAKNNASPSTYGLKPDLSELREFFAAEIATSYPDLRDASTIGTPVKEGEIQGCVKFTRGGYLLTYLTPDSFNALFEQAKAQVSSGNLDDYNRLKYNYYTLDENLNVVVANLTTTTTYVETCEWAEQEGNAFSSSLNGNVSLSMQTCKLPYKNMIQKYSTPFEFYIAMLLTTETPEYCTSLASLAKNSQIIIDIQENDTTITGVAKFDYDIEYVIEKTKTTDVQEKKDNPNTFGGAPSYTWETKRSYTDEPTVDKTVEKEIEGYETVTIIKDSSKLTLGVTLVDAWHINCVVQYQKSPKAEELDKAYMQESEISEDGDYTSVGGKDVITKHGFMSSDDFDTGETKSTGNNSRTSTSYSYSLKGKKIGGTEHYSAKTESSSYVKGQTKIRETPEKFLSLLKVDPTNVINPQTGEVQFNIKDITKNTQYIVYNKNGERISPIGKLFEQRGYLYEFLSSNSKTVNYVDLIKYFLAVYEGKITPEERESSFDFSIYEPGEFLDITSFSSVGGYGSTASVSVFGCSISRNDFISATQSYKRDRINYQQKMAKYAGEFFDKCQEYNINPMFAWAWAIHETGHGDNAPGNNFFGYGYFNGGAKGKSYNSIIASLDDFCKSITKAATPGTSTYRISAGKGAKFSTVNSVFNGSPENNYYVLMSYYAHLGDIHESDEPDFDNPYGKQYGLNYYDTHIVSKNSAGGSSAGGRYYIYYMYEMGGLYKNEYKLRCGHKGAYDPTTVTEQSDYILYLFKDKLNSINSVFGGYLGGGTESEGNSTKGYTSTYTNNINNRTYKVYKQGLYPNVQYGSKTIAAQGCNVTSAAIALSGYGCTKDPAQLINGGSSNLVNVDDLIRKNGVSCTNRITSNFKEEMVNALKSGKTVIVHVYGAKRGGSSAYTQNQHYMAIVGITDDGQQVYVANPSNSYKGAGYDKIDHVLVSCQNIWIVG